MPVMMDQTLAFLDRWARTKSAGATQPFTYEVIVVDDGSRDKTAEIVLTYSKVRGSTRDRPGRLIAHRRNSDSIRCGC